MWTSRPRRWRIPLPMAASAGSDSPAAGDAAARSERDDHAETGLRGTEGEPMTLNGKVAIVTGGNTGIGKSIVLALAQGGGEHRHRLHRRSARRPRTSRSRSRRSGDVAIGVEADVSKVNDLQTLVDAAVKQFGRLDIMVNNAGVETRTSVLDTTEAAVREGARDQPEERVLRHAARGEADDRPGWRRTDHQHHVGPRGLADAGQHARTASPRVASGCSRGPRASSSVPTASPWSASAPARWRRRSTRRR